MAKRNDFSVIDAPSREFCFKLVGSDELHRLPSVGSLPVRVARRLMDVDDGSNAEVQVADLAPTSSVSWPVAGITSVFWSPHMVQV